jgi:sugar lactone lactonase YvrE
LSTGPAGPAPDGGRPTARSWALNLSVPLLAAGLALGGIAHAQRHQNDHEIRPRTGCTTTLTNDSVGLDGALAVGPSGDLFVAETRAGCVIRFDAAGVGHLAVGGGRRSAACPACGVRLARPLAVAVGPDGTVYVLDQADYRLLAVRPDGTETTLIGGPGARLAYRRAFTRDAAGKVFVADSEGVQRIDPSGTVVYVAGGGGGDVGTGAPAATVRLREVSALAAGQGGVLYLAEAARNRVLRLDPAGTITVVAGTGLDGDTGDGGPATKANVEPAGLAADDAGNLYIASQFGHRVRRVDPSGQITSFAGRGATTFSGGPGDGGPAAQAALNYPTAIAFHDGNLYILDTTSRPSIRKVDRAGIITTVVAGR